MTHEMKLEFLSGNVMTYFENSFHRFISIFLSVKALRTNKCPALINLILEYIFIGNHNGLVA